jgi:hypothetical protein
VPQEYYPPSYVTDGVTLRLELEEALEGQCTTARKLQEREKKSEELQEQVRDMKKTVENYNCNILKLRGNVETMVM